jgi:beta-N-acetylhexosaminidase
MGIELLGIGIAGKTLSDLERRILGDTSPYAIVLFGRNIESAAQLRALVSDIKTASQRAPVIMIDQEGGRVDRLRQLVPGLPSAEAFGEGERAEEMAELGGRLIGLALRYFDIEINLAPVVDVRREAAPKGLERRCFGSDPETVVRLAGAFMRGQEGAGVASCIKHFPGIGVGSADPHYGATVIDVPVSELEAIDFVPFRELGNQAGSVMIGHGIYPRIDDPDLPATFSYKLTTDLLRRQLGFDGLAVSDDMEMHAVSDLGSYEEIAERALLAGNDIVLFCSHIERIPELSAYLKRRVETDAAVRARFDEAMQRAERFRDHCDALRASATSRVETFEQLMEESLRFHELFESTRPPRDADAPDLDRRKNSRTPGTGRSGREEWT